MEGVTVVWIVVDDATGVDWGTVEATGGVANAVEDVATVDDGDDCAVVAMIAPVLVVEVGAVAFVVKFEVAPTLNKVSNVVWVACSRGLSGRPAISPLELRRLSSEAELELVWLVVPPTNTLTSSSAGFAGVSNALMALVRSVLVALALNPKDKANCCCCAAVRPETEKVGKNDCKVSVTSYVSKSKGLEAPSTVMELGVGKATSEEAATFPTPLAEDVFCKG